MARFLLSGKVMVFGARGWLALFFGGALLVGACSSSNDTGMSSTMGPSPGTDLNGRGAAGGAEGVVPGAGGAPTVEQETTLSFALPQAGEHYVYVANPARDTVAVIDASTLAIHSIHAGSAPTFLQTLAGRDEAVVLNLGSNDATVIRTRQGASTTTRVPVALGANTIVVSPTGAHAVAYHDASSTVSVSQPGSIQDVTVLFFDPAGDASVRMTVGFRPFSVFFSQDDQRAFVVTEDGVSVLDFAVVRAAGSAVAPIVPLSPDAQPGALDVSITPDGHYALARSPDATSGELRLVDLTNGEQRHLDLKAGISLAAPLAEAGAGPTPPSVDAGGSDAGVGDAAPADGASVDSGAADAGSTGATVVLPVGSLPTDVDLAPSGDFALVAIREQRRVARVPIPGGFLDPTTITVTELPGELPGSVVISPDSQRAMAFTSAESVPSGEEAAAERISILDLAGAQAPRTARLQKTVRAVAIAPDGETAMVWHRRAPGDPAEPGLDVATIVDRSYGYSVVRLDDGFAKLERTPAELGPFTIVPDGSHLFVLFDDPTVMQVQSMALDTMLGESIELGSWPVSVGAVPGSRKVFVGQAHTDGRISFIDWVTSDVQSVTGFELNSLIRE